MKFVDDKEDHFYYNRMFGSFTQKKSHFGLAWGWKNGLKIFHSHDFSFMKRSSTIPIPSYCLSTKPFLIRLSYEQSVSLNLEPYKLLWLGLLTTVGCHIQSSNGWIIQPGIQSEFTALHELISIHSKDYNILTLLLNIYLFVLVKNTCLCNIKGIYFSCVM